MPSLTRNSLSPPPAQYQPWLDYPRIAAVVAVIVIHATGPGFGHLLNSALRGLFQR